MWNIWSHRNLMERKTKQEGETLQDLHSSDCKMVWAKEKGDRMEPKVQLRLHFLVPLPTSLPHPHVNDTATRKKQNTYTNEESSNKRQSHTWSSYFLIGQRSTGVWQSFVQEKEVWHHKENNFAYENLEAVCSRRLLHNRTVAFHVDCNSAHVAHKIMLCGLLFLLLSLSKIQEWAIGDTHSLGSCG